MAHAGNQRQAANATSRMGMMGSAQPTFSLLDNATVTNAGSNVTLTFTEAVKADNASTDFTHSTTDNVLTLKTTYGGGSDIAFGATIGSARRVVAIDPSADLSDGAVYEAITDGYLDASLVRRRYAQEFPTLRHSAIGMGNESSPSELRY